MDVWIATLAILLICYAFLTKIWSKQQRRMPPSPPGALPLVGHLHMLGKLPHRSLQKLAQKHGGLMYLKLGSINTIVASTSDAAREILGTHDQVFASRPAVSAAQYFGYNARDLVWAPYGEHWRSLRKLCSLEILTNKRVEMFMPLRKLEMSILRRALLQLCKDNTVVCMSDMLSDLTFNTMTRILMNKSCSGGTSDEAQKERALAFKKAINDGFAAASSTHLGDFIPSLRWMDTHVSKIREVQSRINFHIQTHIDEHKENWQKTGVVRDFIDVMLSTGELSEVSMKGLALDMLSAGTDTSAVTVEWAFAELLRQPKHLKEAQEELERVLGRERSMEEDDIPKLKFLQAVVKETLRLHPPGPLLLPHESMQACKIGDYCIPEKCRAIVNVYAVGRDPAVWNEPDKFDPERFLGDKAAVDVRGQNYELLPFGSGRRMCPGVTLGITMVQYILGSLLHGFNWRLSNGCDPQELDMTESFGLTVPRATPLLLVPSPRLATEAY